jgi:D-3-phosphoglycerate dehydrogenase
MAQFLAVLLESGYRTGEYERDVIIGAGGEFVDAQGLPADSALDLCRRADGILVRRLTVTSGMIAQFKRCRIIVRYGVGTDNIDVDAATNAGIIVGNVPDYCIDEVSSHAIGMLLDCVRGITWTHASMSRGGWDEPRSEPVLRMGGRTLGVVGLGQIGSAVVRRMSNWGLRILAADPYVADDYVRSLPVRCVDLDVLCRESDYLMIHVPLLPETHHLIGSRQFGMMKPGAILVNTARGPVVDTDALADALDRRCLARAALDVFEEEPLSLQSPLRNHPKVLLTDHMAWHSEESQIQLQTSAARSLAIACTGGLPGSLANPEVLHRLGRFHEWEPAPNMRWQLERIARRGASAGGNRI